MDKKQDDLLFKIEMAGLLICMGIAYAIVGGDSIFATMLLGAAIWGILSLLFYVVSTPARRKKAQTNKQVEFYNECVKNGITQLTSDTSIQKATLIADRIGCKVDTDIQTYFVQSKELAESIERKKQEEDDQARLKQQKAEEQEAYRTLTRYSDLSGREKRIQMLTDQRDACLKQSSSMTKGADMLIRSSQQKEIDWAVHGGIASGIAGGAAGLATAMNVEAKNAQIRAQNAANLAALAPGWQAAYIKSGDLKKTAAALTEEIKAAQIKLLASTPEEELMKLLTVKVETVDVSETGAFKVRVKVQRKKPISVFEDDTITAVIDGTISADLYQEGEKVGSALLVLPTYGIGSATTIEGICLYGAKKSVPYEVKFKPYHLWAMEK